MRPYNCTYTTCLTPHFIVQLFPIVSVCVFHFFMSRFLPRINIWFFFSLLFLANYYISRHSILQHFVCFCLNTLDLSYIYSIPEKFNFIVSLFTFSTKLLLFLQTKYAAILTLIFVDMTYSSSMVSTTLHRNKNRTFVHNFVSQNLLRELLF